MKGFLKTRGTTVVDEAGRRVFLRGVNLGGWLLMEGYFMHAPNRGETLFKRAFRRKLGKEALGDFERAFRDNFIRKDDLERIAGMGLNCVRVPFHYRLVESRPYRFQDGGLAYLDRVLRWAGRYGLRVILDLHAACGAQSTDWHADSLGRAGLWEKASCRKRTLALWEFLADRYRENPVVAGYDVLNEAVTDDTRLLNRFYKDVIRAIRSADRRHILFIEGNRWAMDLDCLEEFNDSKLALSAHAYQPLDFTFNFVPGLRYPSGKGKSRSDKKLLRRWMEPYARIGRKRQRPVFIGEFGVNAREGLYGEDKWLADMLALFEEYGFHWTYWTYKAVKNSEFPDGILSYRANPPWVHRQGPETGWETFADLWPERAKAMASSWRTRHFVENPDVARVLRRFRPGGRRR